MRARAALRSSGFGFLSGGGHTRRQTPRRCGAATFFLRPLPDFKPGVARFLDLWGRPLRMSCDVGGMRAAMLAALARLTGGLVRRADRFGFRRTALAQVDREHREGDDREELGLPVLQRAVPEVRR